MLLRLRIGQNDRATFGRFYGAGISLGKKVSGAVFLGGWGGGGGG